ncbi:hypothetical protein EHV15_35085 [Paenibacillus oralis]|uniref:Uncharacterized protein n=1 Tax=Paenibacillus oralis TaxID=2490856 RepID=A0A3P3T9W2_9BACL|nr:hypothetical protein [Paenibacillus oralis]RRJ54816.1 hypothetical protein EHV15_35085 [Paenibacillus oralis]
MFNKKMKLFQEHWTKSLTDLKREAEGLLEWFQVLENHETTQLSSGELQDRYNAVVAVYNTLKAQQDFLPNHPSSIQLLNEVQSVLEMIQETLEGKCNIDKLSIPTPFPVSGFVSIDDIAKRTILTIHDVNKVLELSYPTFIEQVSGQPLEAKRYAYSALIREFLLEIRNQRIYNFKYLSDLANALHNIPGFMASDFKQFDDDTFWDSIFNKRTEATNYIVKSFLSCLSGYYAWLRKTGPSNEENKAKDLLT